jgi:glycerophosphoryl diester phosphodiesterase
MWAYPKIIAHRGAGILAPENTLAAFRCGATHGFRAVEFDVMLARDGVPVVMHDPVLGRTVGGSGSVADYTSHALTQMDAGAWFGQAYAGERVPTYEQVAVFCRDNDIWMNVELKPVPGFEEATGRVVAQYTKRLFADLLALPASDARRAAVPLFSSFSFQAVQAAQRAAPQIPRALLLGAIPPDWRDKVAALDAVAIDTDYRKLTEAQARAIKEAGIGLFCYTVNEPQHAHRMFAWGADAICTDRLDLIGPRFGELPHTAF